jgi:hypothetical protein
LLPENRRVDEGNVAARRGEPQRTVRSFDADRRHLHPARTRAHRGERTLRLHHVHHGVGIRYHRHDEICIGSSLRCRFHRANAIGR